MPPFDRIDRTESAREIAGGRNQNHESVESAVTNREAAFVRVVPAQRASARLPRSVRRSSLGFSRSTQVRSRRVLCCCCAGIMATALPNMSPPAAEPAEPTPGADSALKRKAADAEIGETDTASPKVRTVTSASAALSRNENTRDGKMSYREEQLALLGMAAPPRNFTNADKKEWTKEERSSYNFQCQMHGPTYASAFMRNYFKENEGKPLPPTAPPRSAYAIFRLERFAEIGCSAGGFMGTGKKKKNYSKQVGNEWTELSEEQQQPYEAMFAAKVEEHEKATEAYEAALEQWEQQKGQPAP